MVSTWATDFEDWGCWELTASAVDAGCVELVNEIHVPVRPWRLVATFTSLALLTLPAPFVARSLLLLGQDRPFRDRGLRVPPPSPRSRSCASRRGVRPVPVRALPTSPQRLLLRSCGPMVGRGRSAPARGRHVFPLRTARTIHWRRSLRWIGLLVLGVDRDASLQARMVISVRKARQC